MVARTVDEENGEEIIRIISARKATARERRICQRERWKAGKGDCRPESIDPSDLPELMDGKGAVIGKFYRPIKETVTIRPDADVLAWLRAQGKGYRIRINGRLWAAMLRSRTRRERG
ncbi:MAG: BrnA antitoxin family protein [Terriglobia bacterium]